MCSAGTRTGPCRISTSPFASPSRQPKRKICWPFRAKQRAMVRKGIKNGLTSQIDPTADRFFALYADNVHRHGTPAMPKAYFNQLLRVFGPDCEVLTVCAPDGKPVVAC